MTTPNINNKLYIRGRLTRDPNYSRKNGPDATAAFFRIAASRPFVDRSGDMATVTDYVEVKVFDAAVVAQLDSAGLNKGAMIAVTARAAAESDTYTKDGKEVSSVRLVAIVDDGKIHEAKIEKLGSAEGAKTPADDDIPA